MNAGTHKVVAGMIAQDAAWIRQLAQQAQRVQTPGQLARLERAIRGQGRPLQGRLLEGLTRVIAPGRPSRAISAAFVPSSTRRLD